ncbi:MAG TPA: hypothetical protein VH008_31360 [Pseudonocardia sp.]|jgi:hypothetical protein|nr:hypothetical protein [Pseudonocardia sp.]HEX4252400.1 hypothetical protein [Pseudonocardia sp.]
MSTRLDAPNLESLEERQVEQQLADVETRLVAHYADQGVNEGRVRAIVEQVRSRFADARIRTFVPILVERAARQELAG